MLLCPTKSVPVKCTSEVHMRKLALVLLGFNIKSNCVNKIMLLFMQPIIVK